MIKFMMDLIQIAIMINLLRLVLKWTVFKKHKGSKKRSAIQKVILISKRRIHQRLDAKLKEQKESPAQSSDNTHKQDNSRVAIAKPISLRPLQHT